MVAPATVRTRVVFASDAPVATVARVEERKRHSVALFQRSPNRITVDTPANGMHNSRELMPRYPTYRTLRTIAIASPAVQVRTADHCVSVLDQNPTWFDLWSR